MTLPRSIRALLEDSDRHRLFTGPSGAHKTALLLHRLLRQPAVWPHTLVWTRSAMAARAFEDRLDAAAARTPGLEDGYRPCEITTPRAWAVEALGRGRYGAAPRRVWPQWVEREAIRAACVTHADRWRGAGDRASADVPGYHAAILQWAGTLALNDLDVSTPPPPAVAGARHGGRARDLAAVLAEVATRKSRTNALGEHDLFPALQEVVTAEAPLLTSRDADVRLLLIDDAQDLPLHAAKLAAAWAQADGRTLWVCADPEAPTSRFRGAIPAATLRILETTLGIERETLPAVAAPSLGRRAAMRLRGHGGATDDTPGAERITCVHVPDEIEEAYEIARRIRLAVDASRHEPSPLRYGDCAIIAQSLQPTGAHLADALAFYDVPFVRRVGTALVNAPVVQYALAYLRALDTTNDTPPDALLTSAFAGHGVSNVAMRVLLRDGGASHDALRDWAARWATLRGAWRADRALAPVLRALARHQILPALAERECARAEASVGAKLTELHPQAYHHLAHLLQIAETLDRDSPERECPIAVLERTAREERAAEDWDPEALQRDAVRILTPHAARDFRFRWLAVVGFTTDRWPPRYRPHVLGLDAATAAWAGAPPLTLWAPDAETHEREWRQLAASALERCDGDLVITVPQESVEGEPLDATAWLEDLGPLAERYAPLAHPVRGLPLAAVLTPAEAAAALRRLHVPDDVLREARAELGVESARSVDAGADPPVDLAARRLSASMLNAFLTCPRQCFYTKLLRAEDAVPERDAAGAFGRAIHTVLEHLHAPDRWPRWTPDDTDAMHADALQLLETAWAEQRMPDLYDNPIQAERMRTRARELLAEYVRWTASDPAFLGAQVVLTETRFAFEEPAAIGGIIDRVDRLPDGRLRIIDYKTSDVSAGGRTIANTFVNVKGATEWRPKNLQLLTYVLGARHLSDLNGTVAEAAFCGLKMKPGKPPRFPIVVWDGTAVDARNAYTLTGAELAQAQAVFEQTVQQVLAGRYPAEPAKPGECNRCGARAMCARVRVSDADGEDNGEGDAWN